MDEEQQQRISDLMYERWERLGVEGLLPEESDYVLLWELHAEVSNGTFDQYLTNPSGDHADLVLAALERHGSVILLDLLRRVLDLLPGGWCRDQSERARRMRQVPDRWGVFRALTNEYYDAIEAEAVVIHRVGAGLGSAYLRHGLL